MHGATIRMHTQYVRRENSQRTYLHSRIKTDFMYFKTDWLTYMSYIINVAINILNKICIPIYHNVTHIAAVVHWEIIIVYVIWQFGPKKL